MECGMVSFFTTIFQEKKPKQKTTTETKENMLAALKWLELRIQRPVCTERRTRTRTHQLFDM